MLGGTTWVEGELRNLSRTSAGHVFFDLVDATWEGPDATRPMLAVALFASERRSVNETLRDAGGSVRMTDGIRIRVGGRLRSYAARSTLQLRMDRIDPEFTIGVLGLERARLLEALRRDGLLRANAELTIPVPALDVALVTSANSAAAADVLDELRRSGYGFRVRLLDARTQGRDASSSMVTALRSAAALGVDVVLLVRGGGAATDLTAFDDETLARTIATLGVPVVTGIGHETDRTVADEVAHTAHKTPTAAAASLVATVTSVCQWLHDARVRVGVAAEGHVSRAGQRLDRTAGRCADRTMRSLLQAEHAVVDLAHRTRSSATVRAVEAGTRTGELARRLRAAAQRATRPAEHRVDLLAIAVRAHDPALALARGWSLTRSEEGRLVRSVRDAPVGTVLLTRVVDGSIRSVVTDGQVRPVGASTPTTTEPRVPMSPGSR